MRDTSGENYLYRDGIAEDLPRDRRSDTARDRALAARHQPLAAFRLRQRVEITNPVPANRPLAGRTGVVILLNESGSAWVRVELPQGRTADYCMMPGECSEEVQS